MEYFPCLQFSLTEKFDLCGPTLQLGLGSRGLRLSLFLCIFIGFVQLSSLDRVGSKNIAHTPHCTFTANRIHISLDLHKLTEGPVATSCVPPSFSFCCPSFCLSALPLCATSLLPLAAHERPITRTFHSLATRHVARFAVLCCAVLCASIAKGRRCAVAATRGAGQSVHDLIIIARCTCTCTADGSGGGDCICIWHVAADEVACHIV